MQEINWCDKNFVGTGIWTHDLSVRVPKGGKGFSSAKTWFLNKFDFQFRKINGFANSFYGWGGEDDDLHHRIEEQNFTVYRSPANIARFYMLKHNKASFLLAKIGAKIFCTASDKKCLPTKSTWNFVLKYLV